MSYRISSYDKNAPRPRVGSRWVWEPDGPCELVEVTEVVWNGEEWWVRSAHPRALGLVGGAPVGVFNDLSRWWEAVRPIAPKVVFHGRDIVREAVSDER